MVFTVTEQTQWRTRGTYLPTLASKASLFEESRLFLLTYKQLKDPTLVSQEFMRSLLVQRSHETRATILRILKVRLIRWHPPACVLDDLITFAEEPILDAFRIALLLHTTRQDVLLYDFVQQRIVPRWHAGTSWIMRSEVQSFLDAAQEDHSEISRWSYSTREKISRNALTVLRDGGLLKGVASKRIVLPYVPQPVANHLIRLLLAEGITQDQLAYHPDWHLFLWDVQRIQQSIDTFMAQSQSQESKQ